MSKPTLETYLRDSVARGMIDHHIRAHVTEDGTVGFYLHPIGFDGRTLDYEVFQDQLAPKVFPADELTNQHKTPPAGRVNSRA